MTGQDSPTMSFTYTSVRPPDSNSQFDFTERRYAEILDYARTRYTFARFGSIPEAPCLLWRHDVDMSVHRALALARLEKDRGTIATYFIRLRAEFYNVFEWPIRAMIGKSRRIITRLACILKRIPTFTCPMKMFSRRSSNSSASSSRTSLRHQ